MARKRRLEAARCAQKSLKRTAWRHARTLWPQGTCGRSGWKTRRCTTSSGASTRRADKLARLARLHVHDALGRHREVVGAVQVRVGHGNEVVRTKPRGGGARLNFMNDRVPSECCAKKIPSMPLRPVVGSSVAMRRARGRRPWACGAGLGACEAATRARCAAMPRRSRAPKRSCAPRRATRNRSRAPWLWRLVPGGRTGRRGTWAARR